MTKKEYEDAIAVNLAIRGAIFDVYFTNDDKDREILIKEYILAISKKMDKIESQWEKETGLYRLKELVKISGFTFSEFSKKYDAFFEVLLGEEVLDESTIASLEKKVCEDKAKANLTWAVFDDNGNVENIITASSREEALKIAEDIWHHLTDYERKHKIRFDVALAHLDEDDEHFGDSWIIAKDFLEEN